MKVLFICGCNIQNGEVSVASWTQSIIHHLDPQIEICIAGVSGEAADRQTVFRAYEKQVPVFLFPQNRIAVRIPQILRENQCRAILLFGTENPFTEAFVAAVEAAGMLEKTILFLQGMCGACARHYYEGVPERVAKQYTFRDLVRRDRVIDQQKEMFQKAEREKRVICKLQNVIGRTTMDRAIVNLYHPEARYFKCNDVLRKGFYERSWSYEGCKKHSIFISQFYYPLKGFHFLLQAASLLLPKYPDLQIVAAGYNPVNKGLDVKELKDSAYIRYLKKLAKAYSLVDRIQLTGILNEEKMIEQYLGCNVFVLPSTIENSPNSLAEAMTLGVPTVSSDVGGVSDYATHGVDAYLYPATEPYLLAHYIDRVFEDPQGAIRMGASARKRGLEDYHFKSNMNTLAEIIQKVSE